MKNYKIAEFKKLGMTEILDVIWDGEAVEEVFGKINKLEGDCSLFVEHYKEHIAEFLDTYKDYCLNHYFPAGYDFTTEITKNHLVIIHYMAVLHFFDMLPDYFSVGDVENIVVSHTASYIYSNLEIETQTDDILDYWGFGSYVELEDVVSKMYNGCDYDSYSDFYNTVILYILDGYLDSRPLLFREDGVLLATYFAYVASRKD